MKKILSLSRKVKISGNKRAVIVTEVSKKLSFFFINLQVFEMFSFICNDDKGYRWLSASGYSRLAEPTWSGCLK